MVKSSNGKSGGLSTKSALVPDPLEDLLCSAPARESHPAQLSAVQFHSVIGTAIPRQSLLSVSRNVAEEAAPQNKEPPPPHAKPSRNVCSGRRLACIALPDT